jgi:acyl-CoA synthetase (AMP-forming)/AMP-acid ligase II
MAMLRGDDQDFLVYGDRSYGFAVFVREANGVSAALRDRFGVGHGDRVAVLSQNNPEWCLTFWATVDLGAILVGLNGWWKADEIVYGLQDSGAKVLVADRKRFERIAGDLGEAPDLEVVLLVDADPDGLPRGDGRQGPAPALRRAHRLPHRHLPRHADRRGRRRRHLLHLGHHRPAQGRHLDAPVDDRQPAEHALQQRGRRHVRRRGAAGRRLPERGAVHLAAVPRLGVPLRPGRRACWPG